MILAALHGKVETTEDALTSSVFGALRYLGALDLLARLCRDATTVDGATLGTPAVAHEDVEMHLWPSLGSVQPDVLLRLNGRGPQILIECKFRSGTSDRDPARVSGDETGAQLADYWLRLLAAREGPEVPAALIYLTAHPSMPRGVLEAQLGALTPEKRDLARGQWAWLSWQNVLDALDDAHLAGRFDATPGPRALASDLRALLRLLGFGSFKGDWNAGLPPLVGPPQRLLRPSSCWGHLPALPAGLPDPLLVRRLA